MNIDKLNISPKEAVMLGDFCTVNDTVICNSIFEEFYDKHPKMQKPQIINENIYGLAWFLATVWNAGRVQGIREERKKRKTA